MKESMKMMAMMLLGMLIAGSFFFLILPAFDALSKMIYG